MDGSYPSNQSKNFYIDWYDDRGNLMKHDAYPIFNQQLKVSFRYPKNIMATVYSLKPIQDGC